MIVSAKGSNYLALCKAFSIRAYSDLGLCLMYNISFKLGLSQVLAVSGA